MSSTDATLDYLRDSIRANLDRATGAGLDTLHAFRDIGRGLVEAKEAIGPTPKGAFGKWCEENFPFTKQWRARLMQLANEWRGVEAAMAWATGAMGRTLGRKEYSVDGALALLAEWIKTAPAEAEAMGYGEKVQEAEKKAEEARERQARKEAEKEQAETEAEALRRMLAEAMERIRKLEAELAKARGEKPKGKAKAEEQAPGGEGPAVDKATKTRAGKVYGLAVKGATRGERQAARGRIEEMAAKFGLSTLAFLAACGLDGAAYEAVATQDAEEAQAEEEARVAA